MTNSSIPQTTQSQTSSGGEEVPVKAITIVLAILIVLSVLGNSLVCSAFVIQPRLRRALYFPVISLAIADILCGLVAMTSYLAKKHVFGGKKEQVVCDISRFSYFVTEYASVFSLTIISVDRALAIIRPLTYNTTVTSKRMKTVLAVAWCYAILVSSLPFYWRTNKSRKCSFRPTNAWSISVIIVNVLLPFLIILMCQASIYVIAIKHSLTIKKQRQVVLRTARNSSRRAGTPRTEAWVIERKATVGLSCVIGLFIICWGPSSIYYFLQKVSSRHFSGTFGDRQGTFNAVVKLLTFANSCFNPMIYAWMNKDFRDAFMRVLSRRLYRSAVEKQATNTASHHKHMSLHVKQTTTADTVRDWTLGTKIFHDELFSCQSYSPRY